MNRRSFVKSATKAAFGIPLIANFEIEKLMTFPTIEIHQLLGLDASHLNPSPIRLEKETAIAFRKMKTAASKADIHIDIASGYRSFEHQKQIWERKYNHLSKTMPAPEAISEIITYSSIPGTSRHHWGTDIDLIDTNVKMPKRDLLLEKNYHGTGAFSKLNTWMNDHAEDFGFKLVYTKDQKRTGFNYEPWHYSYAPKSKAYLKFQLKETYQKAWNNLEFKGKPKLTAKFMNSYFKNYSEGVNPELKTL